MSLTESRAYDALRRFVEKRDGSMEHVREGYRHGAWIVKLDDREVCFEGQGNESLPELDRFYLPRPGLVNPQVWSEYSANLVDGAEEAFLQMIHAKAGVSGDLEQGTCEDPGVPL